MYIKKQSPLPQTDINQVYKNSEYEKEIQKQTFPSTGVYIGGWGYGKDYFKRIAELNIFPNIVFETKKGNELNFEIFLQEHFD